MLPRKALTPEGLFLYERKTGLCIFTPKVRSKGWIKPLYAQISVTEKCNQRCWWCYASSSPEKSCSLPLEELKELMGFLDSWGVLGVAFGGGEPFMYPHLPEIAEWTWNNTGLDVSVTTNGTASSEEQISRLEGYVSEVRVSIRSVEACNTLLKFLNRKFGVGVNLLLLKGNTWALEEIVEECLNRSVADFLVNDFRAFGRGAGQKHLKPGREDFTALAQLIEKHSWKAAFKTSGRLASKLKPYIHRFVPFQDERRGRIIAITADRKVKPSSLSMEAYSYNNPEEIPKIYSRFIVDVTEEEISREAHGRTEKK